MPPKPESPFPIGPTLVIAAILVCAIVFSGRAEAHRVLSVPVSVPG